MWFPVEAFLHLLRTQHGFSTVWMTGSQLCNFGGDWETRPFGQKTSQGGQRWRGTSPVGLPAPCPPPRFTSPHLPEDRSKQEAWSGPGEKLGGSGGEVGARLAHITLPSSLACTCQGLHEPPQGPGLRTPEPARSPALHLCVAGLGKASVSSAVKWRVEGEREARTRCPCGSLLIDPACLPSSSP